MADSNIDKTISEGISFTRKRNFGNDDEVKKEAEEKSVKQFVKSKVKEFKKKKPEIVELQEMEYNPNEYLEEFALDNRY